MAIPVQDKLVEIATNSIVAKLDFLDAAAGTIATSIDQLVDAVQQQTVVLKQIAGILGVPTEIGLDLSEVATKLQHIPPKPGP